MKNEVNTILLHEMLDRAMTMVEVWDLAITQDLPKLTKSTPLLEDRLTLVQRLWTRIILEHTSAPQIFPQEVTEIQSRLERIRTELKLDEVAVQEKFIMIANLFMDLYQSTGSRLHAYVTEQEKRYIRNKHLTCLGHVRELLSTSNVFEHRLLNLAWSKDEIQDAHNKAKQLNFVEALPFLERALKCKSPATKSDVP